jgi:hypothetical protein
MNKISSDEIIALANSVARFQVVHTTEYGYIKPHTNIQTFEVENVLDVFQCCLINGKKTEQNISEIFLSEKNYNIHINMSAERFMSVFAFLFYEKIIPSYAESLYFRSNLRDECEEHKAEFIKDKTASLLQSFSDGLYAFNMLQTLNSDEDIKTSKSDSDLYKR